MVSQGVNRYSQLIERVFFAHHTPDSREVEFARVELESVATELNVKLPKNLGDVVYSFRYRTTLPESILSLAGEGETWVIRPAGRGKYRFELIRDVPLVPNENMAVTKIPDSTPGVISLYALSDEQALLAKLRYNRLVDIFTSVTCYSLQNHLRTTVPGVGQVETDELYVGVDKRGVHYVIPIQAKGGSDRLSVVQIEQDIGLCANKFPSLVCRPVGTQFMRDGVIVLFEFEKSEDGVRIVSEKHYLLVPPADLSERDLLAYRQRVSE